MFKYKLIYSDGSEQVRSFSTEKEASWYIHMEGDHLVKVIQL